MFRIFLGIGLIFCLQIFSVSGQEVPLLWPEQAGQVLIYADTVVVSDEDGNARLRYWYRADLQDSVFEAFTSEGKIRMHFEGKRRVPLSGCAWWYFDSGVLEEKSCWADDQPQDVFQKYFPDGRKAENGRFEYGARMGFWESCTPDGARSQGRYIEDLKDGVWAFFHPDSSLAYEEEWSEGKLLKVSDFKLIGGRNLPGGTIRNGTGTVNRYHLTGLRRQHFAVVSGEPAGMLWEYDTLGRVLRRKQFENGLLEGDLIEFYPDSVPASRTSFHHGEESGLYQAYSPEGKVLIQGYYTRGREDSVWTEWNEKGDLISRYRYALGQLDGPYLEFYPDGKPLKSAYFSLGVQDSVSQSWSPKGMKTSHVTYRSGVRDGMSGEWYDNGKPRSEGNFEGDLETGLWKFWFDNGTLQAEGKFESGRPSGFWQTWFGNGRLASSGTYGVGGEEGRWSFFYPNGQLKGQEIWKKGRLMEVEKCLSTKGKKMPYGQLKEGTGRIKTYSLEGILEGEGGMEDGLPEGVWTYYYPGGEVQGKGTMHQGKREGLWQYFYPDGKLAEETQFRGDQPFGKSMIFDPKGKPIPDLKTE